MIQFEMISTSIHINPFSGMPGNVPGPSLLPILLYPGRFPCCIQCSVRSRPKYFWAHIIHVEVVHMLAKRWQHLSNQLIATLVEFLHLFSVVREQLHNQLFWPWPQCTHLFLSQLIFRLQTQWFTLLFSHHANVISMWLQ